MTSAVSDVVVLIPISPFKNKLSLGKFRSETHRDNSSVRWDVSAVQVTGYQNDKSPKQCNKPSSH